MTAVDLPYLGDVHRAAEYIAELAAELRPGSGESIETTFNGTPMVGYPGNGADVIVLRWHYERRLYQLGIDEQTTMHDDWGLRRVGTGQVLPMSAEFIADLKARKGWDVVKRRVTPWVVTQAPTED